MYSLELIDLNFKQRSHPLQSKHTVCLLTVSRPTDSVQTLCEAGGKELHDALAKWTLRKQSWFAELIRDYTSRV